MNNQLEIPSDILSLLNGHLRLQDQDFIRGFVSCLSYQYPQSKLRKFYDELDYLEEKPTLINSLHEFLVSEYGQ